ncbi:MAG: Asp-tRNA(Asn)/Glu-tRNA(Gln) amidotransferase GatCAB subunit A, partial [Thermodesulfobacteriota bacterium]
VRKAIEQLQSLGATIKSIEIPMIEQIMPVEFALCMSEASAYHRNLLRERADLLTEDVRTYLGLFRQICG